MDIFPIKLEGDNLGKRHQFMNKLVNDAYKHKVHFETIREAPESTDIDRLFKIDLAAKYRNVDYTLQTLSDEDMLYVSRAMRDPWLLQQQYAHIMNPVHLEQNLFPEMRTNAVNKMKQWIHLKLKDEKRCQQFYEYYKKCNYNYALEFLPKTSVDYFLKELDEMPLDKITPNLLKLLSERSPKASETYFKKLKTGAASQSIVTAMQILLKTDPDTYFYIIEHFFLSGFKRLNRKATKYIMANHRDRFEAKPELYAHRVLHLPTVAEALDSDQAKDLITKLARAKYLGDPSSNSLWLTYEFAKPLMKRVDMKGRSEFGKKIFKGNDFGEPITEAPYLIPAEPKLDSCLAENDLNQVDYESILKSSEMMLCSGHMEGGFRFPTKLDILFDEYRFKTFEPTYIELLKRIRKESNAETRRDMVLVLVSKTGGREENVEKLLNFLVQKHINEPISFRAAIVRSLVKRAFAWRLPVSVWQILLKFGHDLGLDGSPADVQCDEGKHAVLLRHILLDEDCPPGVWDTLVNNLNSLKDYKLTAEERRTLHARLPGLLIRDAYSNPDKAITRLTQACDYLDAYKIDIESFPGVIEAIIKFSREHREESKKLLLRLFKARVARKLLFQDYFTIVQTDASYMNALRHDSTVLSCKEFEGLCQNKNNNIIYNVQLLVRTKNGSEDMSSSTSDSSLDESKKPNEIKNLHHNQFFKKLALYFAEDGGLALQFLKILETKASENPNVMFARPLALLIGARKCVWPDVKAPEGKQQSKTYYKMCTALKSNAHWTRPRPPPPLGSEVASLTALANWIHTCSEAALERNLAVLLSFPRHARLVLALRAAAAPRPGLVARALPAAAPQRATRALLIALRILRQHQHSYSDEDWLALKTQISAMNFKNKSCDTYVNLVRVNCIPKRFQTEYCVIMYRAFTKANIGSKRSPPVGIVVPFIECIADHIDEAGIDVVTEMIKEILQNTFNAKYFHNNLDYSNERTHSQYFFYCRHLRAVVDLTVEYLISGNSEPDVRYRLAEVFVPFAKGLREVWDIGEHFNRTGDFSTFSDLVRRLQSIKVFLRPNDYSLPALEAIRSLIEELAPICDNFSVNRSVHLIILFRKVIKQSAVDRPELFVNGEVANSDSYQEICFEFGKLVAQDVEDMVSRYFPLVRSLYAATLITYMRVHFQRIRFDLQPSLLRGLFHDFTKENSYIMGLTFYNSIYNSSDDGYYYNEQAYNVVEDALAKCKSDKVKFFRNYNDLCNCRGMNGCLLSRN